MQCNRWKAPLLEKRGKKKDRETYLFLFLTTALFFFCVCVLLLLFCLFVCLPDEAIEVSTMKLLRARRKQRARFGADLCDEVEGHK